MFRLYAQKRKQVLILNELASDDKHVYRLFYADPRRYKMWALDLVFHLVVPVTLLHLHMDHRTASVWRQL